MNNLYWNPNQLLSYNRILNFVIGGRGIGKTFGMKYYVINRFIKYGEQFIYIKRHKTDMKHIKGFFDDVIAENEFPKAELKATNKEFRINGDVAGWAIPLSQWQKEKSNSYPHVKTVVFDEFIREKDNSGYLPNEVDAFLNLLDTIIRNRTDVRCVCLANSVSLINPYFIYFNLIPNHHKRFNAYKDITIEIPKSVQFAEERKKTPFGRLVKNTDYGNMALNNEFINDSETFIQRRTKNSKFKFSIQFHGMRMGIWVDVNEGLMFLSQDHDPDTKQFYAITKDDQSENTMLMTTWKNNYHLRKMVNAFKEGLLRFDNGMIRQLAYEMFQKMHIH